MKKAAVLSLALVLVAGYSPVFAQQPTKEDVNARIRKEEADNSQIMRTMHFLTDVYGPRLTGSPNLKAAGEWAAGQMRSWGFENAHLEPWDFGHPGWLNERLTAHIISPVKDVLTCEVLSWTPGTNGTVTGKAFQIILPDRPTQEELTKTFEAYTDTVRGNTVLAGKNQIVPVSVTPSPRRMDDKQAKERFDANNPNAGQFGGPRRQPEQPQDTQGPPRLTGNQVNEQIDKFLIEQGALIRVNDA